jgi:isopentenyl phosphate kinase
MDVATSTSAGASAPTVDFIIKLGGAAVTKKSQLETLNPESIALYDFTEISSLQVVIFETKYASILFMCGFSIARQFQKLFKSEGRRPSFIICHGAGSFGHHYAKKYSIHLGTSTGYASTSLMPHRTQEIQRIVFLSATANHHRDWKSSREELRW